MAIELRVDVSAAAPELVGPLEMAASVFVPDRLFRPEKPIAIFAVPGATYSRRYFDMQFDGHESYSQAAYHCDRGFLFVALDPIWVGESTVPEPTDGSLDVATACLASAVVQILDKLSNGTLVPGLAAIPRPVAVGVGQSLGGFTTVVCQGERAPYDGIANLGYSVSHTYVRSGPDDPGPAPGEERYSAGVGGDYRWAFHWEDVPAEIVHMDLGDSGSLMRTRFAYFNSATIPPFAGQMRPGWVAEFAAKITTPVFIGMGERDVSLNAHGEPGQYTGSPDVTLAIFPRMAHMHNFASTRAQLWRRLHDWCVTVPGTR